MAENTELTEAQNRISTLETELARLREREILREAREQVGTALAASSLPEITRARLRESLALNPPVKDGTLDREALAQRVTAAIEAEGQYIAGLTGGSWVQGMGPSTPPDAGKVQESLESSFARLGLSDTDAKVAATGR